MTLNDYLTHLNSGQPVQAGSQMHNYMCQVSNEAMQITCKLNNSYHTPDEVRALMSELTGNPIHESFMLFPPFYTDCGKNITIGQNVFINSGCHFQDQGGITIGDGSLIGHKVTLATLNHGIAADDRGTLYPAPIVMGKNVWIGAGAIVVAGISIGDNSIVGAGSVVTKNVPPNSIFAGIPAKLIRKLE